MNGLGSLYENGRGVKQDYALARWWTWNFTAPGRGDTPKDAIEAQIAEPDLALNG